MFTRILVGLVISLSLAGCGINRAASLRILDQRAEYDENIKAEVTRYPQLKEGGLEGFKNHPVPVRTRPKVVAVYIHPHETATHDYFWGGWISVVTEKDQWVLTKPELTPQAPAIVNIEKSK